MDSNIQKTGTTPERAKGEGQGEELNVLPSVVTPTAATPAGRSEGKSVTKTQIDSLSRNDLIKHVKKQTLLMQKMKSHFEELTAECAKLKEEANTKSENHLIQELQILKSERDLLQQELKSTKKIVLSQEQKYEERIGNILSDKTDLERRLSQLQLGENDALTKNKILSCKVEELELAVTKITRERDVLNTEFNSLQESYESLKVERQRVQDQIEAFQSEFDCKVKEWAQERDNLKSDIAQLQSQSKVALAAQVSTSKELEKAVEVKEQQIHLLEDEVQSLLKQLKSFEEEDSLKENEIASLQLSENLKEKQNSITRLSLEKEELIQQLSVKTAEHKDEVKKLKAYAVKLKKELAEVQEKEKLVNQELINSTHQLVEEQKTVKELKVLLEQSAENYSSAYQELQKEQQEKQKLLLSLKKLAEEKESAESSLHTFQERCSSLDDELQSLKSTLLFTQSELSTMKRNFEETFAEKESLLEAIANERKEFNQTKQKLEKDSKSASLMNLELADYQRSLETLRGQLKDKETLHAKLKQELSSTIEEKKQLNDELVRCKEEMVQKDEIITKIKAMLRKSNKELMDVKAQSIEHSQKSEELKVILETTMQNLEMAKVEIANLTASCQSDLEEARLSQSHYQQLVHSLETKVSLLQTELDSAKKDSQIKQKEFDNYKVRVHSVLKQKDSQSAAVEIDTSLKQHQEVELLKSQAELNQTRERLSILLTEHEELQQEYQQLLNQYENHESENKSKLQQLKNKLLEAEEKYSAKSTDSDDTIVQLRLEIAENTAAFKSQLYTTQKDYQSQINTLQRQLQQVQEELNQQHQQQEANAASMLSTVPPHAIPSDVSKSVDTKVLPTEERSSGEGMDCAEIEISKLYTPTSTAVSLSEEQFPSFEQLLITDVQSSNDPTNSIALQNKDYKQQSSQLVKKVKHLSELLHESEANCVRFTDQTKLLKEEIRRLERNQERQEEATRNMEYLKNVVLKFFNSPDDEKLRLIPIITQLLHLSQQEKHYLHDTLKGKNVSLPHPTGDSPTAPAAGGKSLANYLHRWTGYQ